MTKNKKIKPLKAEQLSALPISVGEASKLLGSSISGMSDEFVARRILQLGELARLLTKTMDLQ